ncbi:hypothetical protein C1922_03400 [Stenotrophomonas sp. ZAC14D2_NAIMI4_7]|uniref:fimbrial protein n=1 Tax=Stenotrophomonas sp. ZAC14D2_NAIMI4_7 TaxID=2072405 RepID=UPI000D53E9F2|nr:hypothetical protein [Stenotrophomonas sp. ZAC14D2_NAIMI4_7]AWH16443.1 hypothetical protein C1922_03400 [Stenotrophomonas sp. ZAC14D2_NAIMI4_7]
MHLRTWLVASMALLGLAALTTNTAQACTTVTDGYMSTVYPVVLEDTEQFAYSFSRLGVQFGGCSTTAPTEFVVEFDTPMQPMGTVEYKGRTYGKFQTSSTSPFVLLGLYEEADGASSTLPFLADGQMLTYTMPARRNARLRVELTVSGRRGVESQPIQRMLGLRIHPKDDASLIGNDTLELGFDVSVIHACTMQAVSVVLDDVAPAELLLPDSSAAERDFSVNMDCSHDGIPVTLTLTDAHSPGNTGSALEPAAGSTAEGVRIELLRAGVPVRMQQPWQYGQANTGPNPIDLTARYARTAGALAPGEIKGEAVLQADYP